MKNKSFAEKLKNVFFIYTILALLFTSIAFAAYVSDQKINGEVNLMSNKDVGIEITNVKTFSINDMSSIADLVYIPIRATENETPTFEYNTAKLNLSLTSSTYSRITYKITVKNNNQNATKKISEIKFSSDENITYSLAKYTIGDAIEPNAEITVYITIKYVSNATITNTDHIIDLQFISEDTTASDNGATNNNYTIKNDSTTNNDLLANNYTKDSISVKNDDTNEKFSVKSLGNGTFLLNGTFDKTQGFFRLTDQIHFSEQINDVAGNVPVETIVPAMTSFDFNVEIISGAQNTTQANQLKLLFIGTDNMNVINKPAYDFYSGIDSADSTDVDISMLCLYITKNIVCKNLVIKVMLNPK